MAEPMGIRGRAAGFSRPAEYRVYTARDLARLPQLRGMGKDRLFAMQVVASVLPFKVNNYVVDHLIDWSDLEDPLFKLTFPQPGMLKQEHFIPMAEAYLSGNPQVIRDTARQIRMQLNPHPAGQFQDNVPCLADGTLLSGMQHKYRETLLFFPGQGQTCHAYCTFCFRWPQFVATQDGKFTSKETSELVQYLYEHPEISDLLFTGGDPMIMSAPVLGRYIDAILAADLPHLRTIRIGTKALSYWPYRFLDDPDTEALLGLLRRVSERGKHLAVMAHVNHPRELRTEAARRAVNRLRETGAEVRSQSPLMHHINDDPDIWADLWREQVQMGIVPYYMFLARDTGAQHYFAVPLVRAWEIYSEASRQVSGLARTARGPSMSCTPGKVEVTGVAHVAGQKVLALRMLQGRNPNWAYRPFFAEYDEKAVWIDHLKPAFGEKHFFFERQNTSKRPTEESESIDWMEAVAA